MSRTGLIVALVLAAGIGGLFAARPDLDLDLAGRFFDRASGHFIGAGQPGIEALRRLAMGLSWVFPAIGAASLALRPFLPRAPLLRPRAAVFVLLSFALGPGLLVNAVLKEHWGRPRPVAVTEFGGELAFVPWWDDRGGCRSNCSFVSGEGAAASTLAAAALAPPAWRPLAYAAALAFGAATGAIRDVGRRPLLHRHRLLGHLRPPRRAPHRLAGRTPDAARPRLDTGDRRQASRRGEAHETRAREAERMRRSR